MAPMTQRRFARVDDDVEDINDFDPRYFPKRVYKDGRGPKVGLMLTDAAPRGAALYDARAHQPHYADLTDARLQDGLRKAHEARQAYIARICDAWKTPSVPPTAGLPPDPDGDEDAGMSPRDRYIRRMQGAYRTPYGRPLPDDDDDADAIEAFRVAQASPGARPGPRAGASPRGVTMGAHDPKAFPSRDAASLRDARADRDRAYSDYVARIENGWRK